MKRILRRILCRCVAGGACVLALSCTPQRPHFPPADELAALIQDRVDNHGVVGIVLGVRESDGSTQIVTAGTAGPGARRLSENTLFEIGSITKVFTATLLADRVRSGEAQLSDPVARHLPDSVRVPSGPGRNITLLDLSTHYSALPRMPDNMTPGRPGKPSPAYTVEQLYAFLGEHELRRKIGSAYEYSNLGVGLLGHALSVSAGTSYESSVRESILRPLGMNMTGIDLDRRMRGWMARGHNLQGEVVPPINLTTLAGAGALRSSAADMLRFLAANVGPPNTELERAMRTAHRPRAAVSDQVSIGLNWMTLKVGHSIIVTHSGATQGFRSFLGFDPVRQVGVVVLTNSAHGAGDIGLHLINPEIPLQPPGSGAQHPSELLTEFAGALVRFLRERVSGLEDLVRRLVTR